MTYQNASLVKYWKLHVMIFRMQVTLRMPFQMEMSGPKLCSEILVTLIKKLPLYKCLLYCQKKETIKGDFR